MKNWHPSNGYVFKWNRRTSTLRVLLRSTLDTGDYISRHWFYEDFIREENPSLPSLQLKKFSLMLFQACPLLRGWSHEHEKAFDDFMRYKTRVPVCGAIMLNPACDKVCFMILLVVSSTP
jgi:hypothetical protein